MISKGNPEIRDAMRCPFSNHSTIQASSILKNKFHMICFYVKIRWKPASVV